MWPLVAEHNTPGHRAAEGCVPATVSVEEAAREWNVGGLPAGGGLRAAGWSNAPGILPQSPGEGWLRN